MTVIDFMELASSGGKLSISKIDSGKQVNDKQSYTIGKVDVNCHGGGEMAF